MVILEEPFEPDLDVVVLCNQGIFVKGLRILFDDSLNLEPTVNRRGLLLIFLLSAVSSFFFLLLADTITQKQGYILNEGWSADALCWVKDFGLGEHGDVKHRQVA